MIELEIARNLISVTDFETSPRKGNRRREKKTVINGNIVTMNYILLYEETNVNFVFQPST